jgi:hypothetical protein
MPPPPDPAHLRGSGAVDAINRRPKKSVTAELIALLEEVGRVQSGASDRLSLVYGDAWRQGPDLWSKIDRGFLAVL